MNRIFAVYVTPLNRGFRSFLLNRNPSFEGNAFPVYYQRVQRGRFLVVSAGNSRFRDAFIILKAAIVISVGTNYVETQNVPRVVSRTRNTFPPFDISKFTFRGSDLK